MKRIWISDFKKNPSLVEGLQVITLLVPYGEDDNGLIDHMLKLGFKHTSTQFVGPDLMDTEQHFRKI